MAVTTTVQELADILGATIEGIAEGNITGIGAIESAGAGMVTFCASSAYQKFLATTRASCVIVAADANVSRKDICVLRVKDPFAAFTAVQKYFAGKLPSQIPPGIHPTALIPSSSHIGKNPAIGPYVTIGERVRIGENAVIYPHVSIGDDVVIGADCLIYPRVTVYNGSNIGERIIIHAGAVIGSDGFGFAPKDGAYEKIPQTGIVVIGNDVEIGANSTIDRATLGETRIGNGCKIDNLVQIAHNVVIGEHTIICAQVGIAGSTKIGSHVTLAGQAGIADHVELGDNVVITAQSGVSKSLAEPGMYRGSPAQPLHAALKIEVMNRQLPEVIAGIRKELNDRKS